MAGPVCWRSAHSAWTAIPEDSVEVKRNGLAHVLPSRQHEPLGTHRSVQGEGLCVSETSGALLHSRVNKVVLHRKLDQLRIRLHSNGFHNAVLVESDRSRRETQDRTDFLH